MFSKNILHIFLSAGLRPDRFGKKARRQSPDRSPEGAAEETPQGRHTGPVQRADRLELAGFAAAAALVRRQVRQVAGCYCRCCWR